MTVRLNLGCGDDRREGDGWVNVDLRADVADIAQAAEDLHQFSDGEVDEILALDLLEHYWRDDVPAVLGEWRRVLRVGGRLTLRVPNLERLAAQLVEACVCAKPGLLDNTLENIYGGHRWGPRGSLDAHHWGYTPATLEAVLVDAGFAVVSNDGRHNMTVIAQKG